MKKRHRGETKGETQQVFPAGRFTLPFYVLFFIFLLFQTLYQTPACALQRDVYKVGPSDVLRISVLGKSDIDEAFPISDDGTINFPLLGDVCVSGLTVKEAERKITDLLGKDYLVNPQVCVNIEKYNSQKVIVWGEVKSSGSYVLTGETSLIEIISQAGGITDKAGSKVMLFRNAPYVASDTDVAEAVKGIINQKDPIIVDIDQLLKEGNFSRNLVVLSGDVVFVEARKDSDINEQRVYVTGSVSKPGSYDYQNGLTALRLCIIAGGFTNRSAIHKTTLIRNIDGKDKIYNIDLDKVKRGEAPDFEVKPGDRLNVPESFW